MASSKRTVRSNVTPPARGSGEGAKGDDRPRRGARPAGGREPVSSEALVLHLASMQAAFDAAPFAVWARDRDGLTVFQNAEMVRQWGDQMGKRPEDSGAPPEDVAVWVASTRRAAAGRTVRNEVAYVIHGRPHRFQNIITPLRAGRRIVGTLGFLIDITEHHRRRDALRESEQLFRITADNAVDAIFVKDASRRYTYLNPAAARLMGKPARDLLGKTPEEVFDAEMAKVVRETDEATFAGEVYNQEKTLVLSGKRYELHTIQTPIRAPDGSIQGICGIVRDVTARKEAERVLRASEQHYRLMAEAVPMMACRCAANGDLIEANRRWYSYTGQTREEAVGKGWLNALHPDDGARVAREVVDTVQGDSIYETEYRLRRASDGVYRWYLARVVRVCDETGGTTAWFGAAADIHEQKCAEELLEKRVAERTEALRENQGRLQRVLDGSNDGYWEWDIAADRVFLSARLCGILGLPNGDAVMRRAEFQQRIHPEDLGPLNAIVDAVIQRDAATDHYRAECRLCRPDGAIVWVQVRATVSTLDAQGSALRVSGAVTDITERKRAEEVRQKLERQCMESSERERRRIGRDLHDSLGQLLTGLALSTRALQNNLGGRDAEDAARISETLRKALVQTRGLVTALHCVRPGPDGLQEGLRAYAETVRDLFDVRCRFDCARPVLVRDPAVATHLYRIAQEAVHNAVRHGKASELTISLRRGKGGLMLQIKDNGKGFDVEGAAGTGLGLDTMRYRAEALAGALQIDAAAGRGTCVICTVPVPKRR